MVDPPPPAPGDPAPAVAPPGPGTPADHPVLRPYQETAIRAILDGFRRGARRQLLIMATGLGKTVVVAALAARSRWSASHRFLGIMHREELIDQAREKLAAQNPGRTLDHEQGAHRAQDDADIVLASIQTLARGRGERLARFPAAAFSKVWVDEVHHAPARSYVRVLEHFGFGRPGQADRLLLGTTATPERLDRLGYDRLFDDVVFEYGLRQGIEDGWLAGLIGYRVRTEIDLSRVRVLPGRGDFDATDLGRAVDVDVRNRSCLTMFREHASGLQNLVFCVTQDHARHVAGMFEAEGVPVGLVVERTRSDERRRILREFREGKVQVLVNVTVLTEGFDAPGVGAIHLLRPTRSRALYLQMLGRGTRRAPGKDSCLVFDYVDQMDGKDLQGLGPVFGLPEPFDFQGSPVLDTVERIEGWERDLDGLPAQTWGDLGELRQVIERCDPIKLYATTARETEPLSGLAWRKLRQDQYAVSWRNPTRAGLADRPGATLSPGALEPLLDPDNLWGLRERLRVRVNPLGHWELHLETMSPGAPPQPLAPSSRSPSSPAPRMASRRLQVCRDLPAALAAAESWIQARRPHTLPLLDRTAPWTRDPATLAQIRALLAKGYPQSSLLHPAGSPRITKGEATLLLSKPLPGFVLDRPG